MPDHQAPADSSSPDLDDRFRSIRRVLRLVLAANVLVAVLKIGLGLFTGALAVVADGFHSLVDMSSNLIALVAVQLSDRPADEHHPYGYGRYETIGSMAIGVLLLGAAIEITRSIIGRLSGGPGLEITPGAVVVLSLILPINIAIVILETRAGRRLGSPILLADAAHTRADLFINTAVILSLVGGWLGWSWLDPVVAAFVVALMVRSAYRILKTTSSWLTDEVIADPEQVEAIATAVPGVLYVHRIRSRGAPRAGFVDLHVKVYPGMSTAQAHAIASEVEERLKAELPSVVDALIHIEPARFGEVKVWDRITYDLRQVADSMGLGFHDLHVHTEGERRHAIELHLEMPGGMSLGEAHDLAEAFEDKARERLPSATRVITHMEPLPTRVLGGDGGVDPVLENRVRASVVELIGPENLLSIHFHPFGDHYSAAVRICLAAELSLEEAHHKADQIERFLLGEYHDLKRVLVHVEPR